MKYTQADYKNQVDMKLTHLLNIPYLVLGRSRVWVSLSAFLSVSAGHYTQIAEHVDLSPVVLPRLSFPAIDPVTRLNLAG